MANQIQEAFDNIKADSRLKESTRQFLSQRRAEKIPRHRPIVRRAAAVLCILLIFAAGISGYSWTQTTVSFISIDVNPSIELALNRFDRVVSVLAFNAEGEEIIGELNLKGKKYTDAVNRIMESGAIERFLTDEAEIVFTVAAKDGKNDKIRTGIEHCHSQSGSGCYSVSADIELVSEAHENGLSLGKYNAYLQLAQVDNTVTVDDCRDMSMSEIHRCIRAHGTESEDHGPGQGYKNEGSGTTSHHGGKRHHGSEHE